VWVSGWQKAVYSEHGDTPPCEPRGPHRVCI